MHDRELPQLGLHCPWPGVLGLRYRAAIGGAVYCVQTALSVDLGHVGVDAGCFWPAPQNSKGVAVVVTSFNFAVDLEYRFGLRAGLLLVGGERP